MLIVKVRNGNIEKALKEYKSKVIKTRQMTELNDRKTFEDNTSKRRRCVKNASYKQKLRDYDK